MTLREPKDDFDRNASEMRSLAKRLSALPSRDMGGGLHIVSLPQAWMKARERDYIVRALDALATVNDRCAEALISMRTVGETVGGKDG